MTCSLTFLSSKTAKNSQKRPKMAKTAKNGKKMAINGQKYDFFSSFFFAYFFPIV